MAKIVIAGSSNCPHYAKIELLADYLAKNLDNFKVHKIVKHPTVWEAWLKDTCQQRGWKHDKSPLVWRELIDRGGKGVLIGGANDFQEYANGYYDIKSDLLSDAMTKVAAENEVTQEEIDREDRHFKSLSRPIKVCISNASSPVSYNLIHAIASGECFGKDNEISLVLLDKEDKTEELNGIQMEAIDLLFPLLRKVTVTTDANSAFKNCVAIIVLDEVEQQDEESSDDWLKRNKEYFENYANIIGERASNRVRVILAGNGPLNFNVLMMIEATPKLGKKNVVAVSRLVENRAKAVLAEKLKVNSANVVDVIVWGNPNGKNYLDVSRSRVHRYDGAIWGPPSFSLPAIEMVADDKWLQTEFLESVTKRKETVETAMKHSAARSHAAAVATMIGHWWMDSPEDQIFSLGVYSKGKFYGIPEGMVYSMPVRFQGGRWHVVNDLQLTDDQKEQLNIPVKELLLETYVAHPERKPVSPKPSEEKVFGKDLQQGYSTILESQDLDNEETFQAIMDNIVKNLRENRRKRRAAAEEEEEDEDAPWLANLVIPTLVPVEPDAEDQENEVPQVQIADDELPQVHEGEEEIPQVQKAEGEVPQNEDNTEKQTDEKQTDDEVDDED